MQSMSKFDERIRFLLCVIYIYSKYAWDALLKDKKGITITNTFQKFLDESNCKPKKYWYANAVNFTIDQSNHGCKIMV